MWRLELNTVPLQEQQVLFITEPPLQALQTDVLILKHIPYNYHFYCYICSFIVYFCACACVRTSVSMEVIRQLWGVSSPSTLWMMHLSKLTICYTHQISPTWLKRIISKKHKGNTNMIFELRLSDLVASALTHWVHQFPFILKYSKLTISIIILYYQNITL